MRFDELDQRIVALLAEDARISNREAARVLGISDTAVRKRLKRLSEAGYAKITAMVDSEAAGLTVAVIVRVVASPKIARSLIESIAELEEVSFAALMTGRFNVVFLVAARTRREVTDIIHSHLRRCQGVHLVETIELVDVVKYRLDIALVAR
jgi:Lrp/AsnC family transcriptional regulator, regulator for asnA, asnC and gidA